MKRCGCIWVLLLAAAWLGCAGGVPPTVAPGSAPPQVRPSPVPTGGPSPSLPPTPSVPAFAATPSPTEVPTPLATPVPPPPPTLPDAPDRDLYQLAVELRSVAAEDIPPALGPSPAVYAEGRRDTFWLVDLRDLGMYSSPFELRLVTPNAYWYFEEGQSVAQADIEAAAAAFEDEIYPRITSVFGREWPAGGDGDSRLTILNARLRGVGGYYHSSDEYPSVVAPYSNERKAIYLNSGAFEVGSWAYLRVLAHELQHAVHWTADPSEEQWVNEGLSELAVTVAGMDRGGRRRVGPAPVSLVNWPLDISASRNSYEVASLFMHYLWEHYGDSRDLRPLLQEPRDGAAGVTEYLEASGYGVDFRDVFGDWVAANLLDEDRGPYGYSGLDVRAAVGRTMTGSSELSSRIPQYSVEYVELSSLREPLRVKFQGAAENRLLPVEVGPDGCWWGNSGDNISATLTRSLDLRGLEQATLSYQVWFSLEEDWDYGYLQVSGDGGRTWDILGTPNTTRENPVGNSYGMGYTGDSGGWLDESVDLSGYAGRQVQIRFHHVTDDALHGPGMCVRAVAVPEANGAVLTDGWQPAGFLLTDNRVRQEYVVQVIEMGRENRVRPLGLDQTNTGEIEVVSPGDLDRLVVAVAALAPKTREGAPYTLTVEPAAR